MVGPHFCEGERVDRFRANAFWKPSPRVEILGWPSDLGRPHRFGYSAWCGQKSMVWLEIADRLSAACAGPTPGQIGFCSIRSSLIVYNPCLLRLEEIVKNESMQNVIRAYESARWATTICASV